jgi:hypothetical protein
MKTCESNCNWIIPWHHTDNKFYLTMIPNKWKEIIKVIINVKLYMK